MRPGSAFFILAALFVAWGGVSLIVRLVEAPTSTVLFYRVLIGSLTLAAYFTVTGTLSRLRTLRPIVPVLGAILALHWFFFFTSLRTTSVASAVLTTSTSPIWLALLAPVFLQERGHWQRRLFSTALVMAGVVALVGSPGDVRLEGVAYGLLAAVFLAVLVILSKRLLTDTDPAALAFGQSTIATVLVFPFALGSLSVSGIDFVLLAVLGAVFTALFVAIYMSSIRNVPAQTVGVLSTLEPLSAAVMAAVVLNEPLTPAVLIAGVLILGGAFLAQRT